MLYPGTWGNPNTCSTKLRNIGCPSAPHGPVFLDLKLVALGFKSEGSGQRWLDPWKWSKEFKGADKIKDCPPPQEEPKPEPSPTPKAEPIQGVTGTIWGDPHISTFDGLRNSFQAVGEFDVLQSLVSKFDVQARFSPAGSSRNASIASAVAIKSESNTIGIYGGENSILKVSRKSIELSNNSSFTLPEGGVISRQGNEYKLKTPNREYVRVIGTTALTIHVTIPEGYRSKVMGLLGNFNGNPQDDLRSSSAKVFPPNLTYDQLYKEFADSWRVEARKSLFDYAYGESTRTFTDRNFPEKVLTLADFTTQQKQEAERVCRAAGVTNSVMLESCMFDVLVTGDRSFANISAYVQSEVKVTANVTPIISAITETTKPKPEVISNLISSATGVNYSKLGDLLAAGNWKDADKETYRGMAEARFQSLIRKTPNYKKESFDSFPCEDLQIIDQLWVKYSNGKFGFSVQKEIYKSLGGTKAKSPEILRKFGDIVGWKQGKNWLYYYELTFNLNAPKGYLPLTFDLPRQEPVEPHELIGEVRIGGCLDYDGTCSEYDGGLWRLSEILYRLENCNK